MRTALRHAGCGLTAAVCLCFAAAGAAQTCAGDCSGDRAVGVSELVQCVNIALGNAPAAACAACDVNRSGAVMVDDLIAAVNAALNGCAVILTADGICLRPGPQGLEPCPVGTVVRALRCDDPQRCAVDASALTLMDVATVGPGGTFTLDIDARAAAGQLLIFEAEVEPATDTTYRIIDLGSASSGDRQATGGVAGLMGLLIDPISEAATRILAENGLERFSAGAAREVSEAVRAANDDTSFADVSAASAAEMATAIAAAEPAVGMTIERVALTAVDITAEGTVQASSVFGDDEFSVELAVDGDRGTAWFSNGEIGGAQETYRWTGAHDESIASIAVLSNAEHASRELRGFGFARVRIQVLDAAGAAVLDTERGLPGFIDPDVVVAPDVVGRSVLLTFTGHDEPVCGGFAELHIVARR